MSIFKAESVAKRSIAPERANHQRRREYTAVLQYLKQVKCQCYPLGWISWTMRWSCTLRYSDWQTSPGKAPRCMGNMLSIARYPVCHSSYIKHSCTSTLKSVDKVMIFSVCQIKPPKKMLVLCREMIMSWRRPESLTLVPPLERNLVARRFRPCVGSPCCTTTRSPEVA